MIDANSQFFAILTNVGMAKQANADALGIAWKLTEMGVGDANPGGLADPPNPIPSATQNKLLNEWRRKPLNQLRVDPVNPAVIIAEQIIPADEGGKWIREIGLYDADGDLVAVANCAPSFKPLLSQGSGRTQVVRMNFVVSSTAQITLKIDPSVVLATRDYVDSRILDELSKLDIKQSVRVATTANISLVGLQTIDGVALAAGDRVLVKNQTAAKDNGPYVAAVGAWTRAKDADNNMKMTPNLTVAIEVGATQADTIWQLVTDGLIVVGTTALTFKDISDGFARLLSPSFAGNPTAPTPAQFDASKSIPTTEFLKRRGVEYSGFSWLVASTVLSATHIGGYHTFSSPTPVTATLPPMAGIPQGVTVTFANANDGAVSVVAASGEAIYIPTGSVGALLLGLGDTAEFTQVGGQWRLSGGTVALRFAGTMKGPNFVTPPKFDSSLRLATTEFAQRAQGSYAESVSYNGSTTLTAADVGRLVAIGGTSATVTLPDAAPVASGAVITILASTTVGLTIQAKAGQSLSSLSSVVGPLAVLPSSMSVFRRLNDGTGWVLEDGDAALKYSPLFASSQGASGWAKRPDGLIEQWGSGITDANGYVYVTYPIPFPGAVRNVMPAHFGSSALMHAIMDTNYTLTGCRIRVQNAAGAATAGWYVLWRALGN
jgi:hypothetical protein